MLVYQRVYNSAIQKYDHFFEEKQTYTPNGKGFIFVYFCFAHVKDISLQLH